MVDATWLFIVEILFGLASFTVVGGDWAEAGSVMFAGCWVEDIVVWSVSTPQLILFNDLIGHSEIIINYIISMNTYSRVK